MADDHKETEETTTTGDPAGGEETAAEAEESVTAEAPAAEAEEAPAAAEPAAAEPAAESEAPADEAPADEAADEKPAAAEEAAPAAEPAAETGQDAAEPAAAEAETPAAEAAAAGEPAPAEHTYEELKGMTVVRMREIAGGLGDHDALHGYTTMHKEELLVALCTALGIEAHEHHEVVGIDKGAVKARIRALKSERDALIEAGDSKQLKIVRRRIRGLKRKIHKATV